jgi:hypothetical protein
MYLWDLVDEGYDVVLPRLREAGLSSISLATAYHAGKFLSPHNPKRKVVFPEDGTVYFSPDPSLYGRIKPLVNTLVHEGHDLARVRRGAHRHGLGTNAWVVCCHNMPLGLRYPDVAVRTAFGDSLPHNLCPSNPDVRSYLIALVKDIASLGVETIELEALQFQGYTHGYHHEREGLALTVPMRFLLGLCYCPSCLRRSSEFGVPISRLQAFTRATLSDFFKTGISQFERVEDLPSELIIPFLRWRESVIGTLAEELLEAAGPHGPALRPLVGPDPAARRIVSMDPVSVGNVTGGVILLAYVREGEEIRGQLEQLRSALGRNEVRVGMHLGMPETGGKKEFLSRMKACRQAGVTRFNFYNYGMVPLENLAWIQEGLQ